VLMVIITVKILDQLNDSMPDRLQSQSFMFYMTFLALPNSAKNNIVMIAYKVRLLPA
jgi:hypothetical protein